MLPGFKSRLLQELKWMIKSLPEFEALTSYVDKISIPDCVFAPNICQWVGASLMITFSHAQSSTDNLADRFGIALEQYEKEGLPDRYLDVFLGFKRKQNHFNKTWEINYKNMLKEKETKNQSYSPNSIVSMQGEHQKTLSQMMRFKQLASYNY